MQRILWQLAHHERSSDNRESSCLNIHNGQS